MREALSLRIPSIALAAAALTIGAVPAAAEVVEARPGHFVTRAEAVVDATPKEVWLALISPSRWWSSEHTWSGEAANLTLTPQAGGCFCEKIPEVDEPGRFTLEGSVEHMRVIQAYPERALRMTGALGPLQSEPVTGVLTIVISTVEGEEGTRIVWEYNVGGAMRYELPVIGRAVDGVMTLQLTRLAEQLGVLVAPTKAAGPGGPGEGGGEAPADDAGADDDAEDGPVSIDPEDMLEGVGEEDDGEAQAEPKPSEPAPSAVDEAFGDLTKDDGKR